MARYEWRPGGKATPRGEPTPAEAPSPISAARALRHDLYLEHIQFNKTNEDLFSTFCAAIGEENLEEFLNRTDTFFRHFRAEAPNSMKVGLRHYAETLFPGIQGYAMDAQGRAAVKRLFE